MPTINQLVRKGRKQSKAKATSPALRYQYNSLNRRLNYGKG
ncbi:MAG: 30S ribosomal protein S12, partial [Firmicutes bacterium]|nr:30S ribosomal protein S12 [Bacillota bacterium]